MPKTNSQKGATEVSTVAAVVIVAAVAAAISMLATSKYYEGLNSTAPIATATPAATLTPAAEETPSPAPIADEIADWQTYTNDKYGYEVKYPQDWIYRQFPDTKSGAGFKLQSAPDDIQYEVIDINVNGRPLNSQKISFQEYVKIAAVQEIQNYDSLKSIEKVTTQSGLIGYKTTWNVSSITGGKSSVSLPITYFDTKNSKGDTVQISISDEKYLEIYGQMLSTFSFTEKS
ncbi:MAG: hypothetical protein WC810_26305, partial [Janthinobacterium sp.]